MKARIKVAIIGAGPAGIAAAVQLNRSGINPLLFEKSRTGGLLNNAYQIENYPGFPDGISGIDLVKKLKKHLKRWRIKVVKKQVVSVIENNEDFVVQANKKYKAQILIIASGTKPKLPKIALNGFQKRIFSEIYPIRNIRDKKIVIVGAGDAAFDYALNLNRYNRVILLNRNKKTKGLDLLYRRIKKSDKKAKAGIDYFNNTEIQTVKQLNNCLIAEVVKADKKSSTVRCDYMLFAIGREPALDFLSPSLRQKFPNGDKRIYFIGDVQQGNLRQIGIATGDGIKAAMRIHEYLKTQRASSGIRRRGDKKKC